MQDLSETLELIRWSIYGSWGLTIIVIVVYLFNPIRRMFATIIRGKKNRRKQLEWIAEDSWQKDLAIASIEQFLKKKFKTFKPYKGDE